MIKSSINKESIVTLIWILSISLCAQYFFAISYKILLQASHKLYICSIAQIIAYVVNISLVIISSVKYNNILIVLLLYFNSFIDRFWNPFLLAMSIAMFNIARNIHFKNRFINYISKLSLLIYIIHENIILRTYFRPAMWNYVYKRFGYSDVIQWVFIISFIIFIFGILCSILYVLTLQRFVNKVSGKLYEVVRIKYLLFEKFCLMIGEKKDNR